MVSPTANGLLFTPSWDTVFASDALNIPADVNINTDLVAQCHLVASLILFLHLSLREFVCFLFETPITKIKTLAGEFMAHRAGWVFCPSRLYAAWHTRWPRSRPHLHDTIIKSCAREIALAESDRFINDPDLKVKTKECTMDYIRRVLDPGALANKYQSLVPFCWDILLVFTTSPNRYRKAKAKRSEGKGRAAAMEDDDSSGDEYTGEGQKEFVGSVGSEWRDQGFTRNATFTLIFVLSMMGFVRNGATNMFPVIFGLFLESNGTSSRVLSTLSSAGVCVSISTIERLKSILSVDARRFAVELMSKTLGFFTIFDNINLYLRKAQQRLFNRNTMIHATNTAVIGLPDAKPEAFDLPAKLALRGKRAAATGADLMPTGDDEIKMGQSFKGIVVLLLLSYCPGSNTWEDRDGIRKLAEGLITKDRPLPPQKTDARPLGVFDVNEGSKKGILKMLVELQKTSQLSQEEWSAAVRIIEGDWLTSNNLRGARKDRTDDINGMERVEYPEELSALWHFALNATHMLMRLHLGHAIVDPGSLAKHKGLLNRNWDAEKPNYADAKALIRHSLIARILYSAMLQNGIDRWADLHKWEPTVEDVEAFANNFVEKFAMPSSAEKAKAMNDDYLAHSVYFIRDALIFCVFEHAVSHADAGPVLRVLKYWTFSFRGAGLHNYGRECAEVLLRWQYELTSASREALEQSWFVNRWGRPERWIAADLYLEQLNYWVKRVFIAKGSAVTVEYIIEKGSAPVEFWRELSHAFARAFGYPDRARRSKEVDVGQDLRLLTENLIHSRLHVPTADRPIYANTSSKQGKKQASDDDTRPSAIVDAIDVGGELWNNGKFTEFIRATTWDPAVGYPVGQVVVDAMGSESVEDADDVLMNGSVFDQTTVNPLAQDAFEDIDDGDDHTQRAPGMGGLGGGMDYTDTIT